jgi:Protein of unknown function (DUF3551)
MAEVHMRNHVAVPAIVLLALLTSIEASRAEVVYPWCAQYSTRGGARNCGFTTWEQCRATVSGIGGYCIENPFYRPAAGPVPRRKARRAVGALPSPAEVANREPRIEAVSAAARTYRPLPWCHLKGRRGDPQLFLRQQAGGCF